MVFFTWTLRSRGGLEVTMAATSPLQTVIKAKGYLVTSLSIKVKKRREVRLEEENSELFLELQ